MVFVPIPKPLIAPFFNLKGLWVGYQNITETESVNIQSYWIAKRQLTSGYLAAIVVQTNKWHRGLLFIPPMDITESEYQNNGDLENLKPVDLEKWSDPVIQSLKSISLYSEDQEGLSEGWGDPWRFILEYETYGCSGIIEIHHHTPKTVSLTALGNSICSVFDYLIEQHDNDTIRRYLEKGRKR